MPIYEYQCQKCKKTFEYMQPMSEAPKKKCEKCGGKLDKLISAAGFVLKGGGWYKDLYASPKGGSGGDESGGGSASSGQSTKGAGGDKAEKADKADKADKAPADKPERSEKKSKKKSSKGR